MKRFLLILICLAGIIDTHGQYGRVVIEVSKEKKKSTPIIKVQVSSTFPAGDTTWRSVEKNLKKDLTSMVIDKRAKKENTP